MDRRMFLKGAGVFCFGDAPFLGRPDPGLLGSRRAVAIASALAGQGYLVAASR